MAPRKNMITCKKIQGCTKKIDKGKGRKGESKKACKKEGGERERNRESM